MRKLVKCGTLIKGTDEKPLSGGCMLLRGDRIEKIGPLDRLGHIQPDTEVIDLSDVYVLPGLIDSHTHLSIVPGEGDQLGQMRQKGLWNILRSIPHLSRNLKSGVTTQRIMGEEHYIDIYLKRAINAGYLIGPRLLVSGKQVVASNGHGVALTTADGEAEIRKLARRNLAMGADLIKIFVTGGVSSPGTALDLFSYTPQEVEAAVEEAARAGTYVAAHAHGGRGLDICIEKGVRTIEHGAFIASEQIEHMKNKGMWVVGTFSILFHPEGIEKADFASPTIKEKVSQARDVVAENWRNVIASGLDFALGTDSMHGMIGFEAEYLCSFGASEGQAVRAVTRDAARACGIEAQFGTLEEGKIADFVAVRGDPLIDIKNLQRVIAVYMGGNKVHGNTLELS